MTPRKMTRRSSCLFVLTSLFLASVGFGAPKEVAKGKSEGQAYIVEKIVQIDGLMWSFDFLPDGRIVMNERSGKMFVLDPKTEKLTPVKGVPKVWEKGQGGLLEVRVHPNFAKTKWLYLTYSAQAAEVDEAATTLARAKLEGDELKGFEKLYSADSSTEAIHFGSRIEFDGKGHLFMSSGERNERKWAQDLGKSTAKILRFDENGKTPSDNPFVKNRSAKPEIYSYGHRNQQGLAYDAKTGELWEAEFGPRGGDELNLIKPGANYGWPVITYGKEYYGPSIGEGTSKAGMEQPVAYWVPSISPSGLAIYRGSAFPKWDGNAFLACLSGQQVRRVSLVDGKATKQETLLSEMNLRFRAVRVGPEGFLYLSTDDGQLLRVRP